MSPTPTITTEIKKPKSKVFRKFEIKRRQLSDGKFESDWQDLSDDVKKWGTIKKSVDDVRYSRVRFSDLNLTMANDNGRYNPEGNLASFWNGYASQQRTLVRVQAGFINQTLGSDGIWSNTTLPDDPTVFVGVIQGDIPISDSNEIVLPVKPLLQVFRDYATRNLNGLSSGGGMTAKEFIELLRDQTDGAGELIFRPFFQDTTTYWEYTSSSIEYVDISSDPNSSRPTPSGDPVANDFLEMNVWDAIEKLGEAENLVPRILRDGTFRFADRSSPTIASQYSFYGRGYFNTEYGHTIKRINSYKKKYSDYYSRVEVKWSEEPTTGATAVTETAFAVSGTNDAWNLGHRTFDVENYWIATLTAAESLCNSIYQQTSAIQEELDFTTSFVPQLDILDLVKMNYDSGEAALTSRWDLADWADDATTLSEDLIWSYPEGDTLLFNDREFKLNSIELNLDNFESKFKAFAI